MSSVQCRPLCRPERHDSRDVNPTKTIPSPGAYWFLGLPLQNKHGQIFVSDEKRFSHDTFDGIAPPFWSLLAPTDETEAILYTVCVKRSRIFTRMTNYPALANFRTFNIDGVKRVLLLLWDIIKIKLESVL
eukprot:scaffold93923_cov54-Attheya_sp.AAC.3